MHAYAILVVNDHLDTLRHEAAMRRSLRVDQPSATSRIVMAARSALGVLSASTEAATPVVPTLTDYPYRS